MVGDKPGKPGIKCFELSKDILVDSSRKLVFADNDDEDMADFKKQVTIMINIKIFIQDSIKQREHIDSSLTGFLTRTGDEIDFFDEQGSIVFKDCHLHAEHRMKPLLAQIHFHKKLQRLSLTNCGIGDRYFGELLSTINFHRLPLVHLDFA